MKHHRTRARITGNTGLNTQVNPKGTPQHLMVVWLDDPPPMAWSQDTYGRYAPTPTNGDSVATSIERQQLYPKTPFLDFLARNGQVCAWAHGAPVCSTGRASVTTGELACTHGVGAVTQIEQAGGLTEFGDTGFDSGTTIWETLDGEGVRTAFVGKIHLGVSTTDGGSGFDIMSRIAPNLDFERVIHANLNKTPVPTANTAGGPYASGVNEDGTGSQGSYYFYRVRQGTTDEEYNIGNTVSPGSGQANPSNSDGQYCGDWLADQALEFWQQLDAEDSTLRGYMYLPLPMAHSPADVPPSDLRITPGDAEADYARRQNVVTESIDRVLAKVWNGLPPRVRQNMTIIIAADNGIDPPFFSALAESSDYDPGEHIVQMNTLGRTKSTVFRYGIGVQVLTYGPTVTAHTFTGLVNAPCDIQATIADYFDADITATNSVGISMIPSWDGTATLATWTRQSSWHASFSPNGSPDSTVTALFDAQDAWDVTVEYTPNDLVHHQPSGVAEAAIYEAQGTATGPEPGATGTTQWDRVGARTFAWFQIVTSEEFTGEPGGLYKLVRDLRVTGEDWADRDQLYRLALATGGAITDTTGLDAIYEVEPVDHTATTYDAIYADMAANMETAQGFTEPDPI